MNSEESKSYMLVIRRRLIQLEREVLLELEHAGVDPYKSNNNTHLQPNPNMMNLNIISPNKTQIINVNSKGNEITRNGSFEKKTNKAEPIENSIPTGRLGMDIFRMDSKKSKKLAGYGGSKRSINNFSDR